MSSEENIDSPDVDYYSISDDELEDNDENDQLLLDVDNIVESDFMDDLTDEETIYENIYEDETTEELVYEDIDKVLTNKLRVVILGKTGFGKSSTANSLIKKTGFKAKTSSKSVTRECSRGESVLENDLISVVDTPGLFDTDLSNEEIIKSIVKCMTLSYPGPHVFLIVLQIGRFTDEEIKALDQLFEIFGHSMEQHAILIFTRYDDLQRDGTSIEEYITDGGDILKKYIDKCKGGYFAVNNVASKEDKENQTDQLVTKIQTVVRNNNDKHYTNEMFQKAKALMRPIMEKINEEENKSTKKAIEACKARVDEKKNEIKKTRQKILEKIEQHKKKRANLYTTERFILNKLALSSDDSEENKDKKKKIQKAIRHLTDKINELYSKLEGLESTYEEINVKRNAKLAKIKKGKKEKLVHAMREATEDHLRKIEILMEHVASIDQQIEDISKELIYAESEDEIASLTAKREELLKEKKEYNREYIKNMIVMSDSLKKKITKSGKRNLCKVQ